MSRYDSDSRFGHQKPDIVAFGRNLATELGATMTEGSPDSAHPHVVLHFPQGFRVTLSRADNGGGKVCLHGWWDENDRIEHYSQRVAFPVINVSPDRGIQTAARDVQRRLVEPSIELANEVRARLSNQEAMGDQLAAVIKQYTEAYPGLSIKRNPGNSYEADFSLNVAGNYLYGSVNHEGRLYIQRCCVADVESSKRLLAVIARISPTD